MNLGLAVKTLRKNKGLTQGNLCEMVGITQSYLSQVENGNKEPSIYVVKKIANALEIPMAMLFWFALTEKDVDDSKVQLFKSLKPSVDSKGQVFRLLKPSVDSKVKVFRLLKPSVVSISTDLIK